AESEQRNEAGAGEALVPAEDDEETERLPVVRRLTAKGQETSQASLTPVAEAESEQRNEAGAGEALVPAEDDEETERLPVVRRLATKGQETSQASLKLLGEQGGLAWPG
ncbi:MAG: hypothetical protein IRZ31_18550, partial [Thermogemmatispora sp.]|uniref:hypothetical protein n=1 Tax=Thermogemmatispora sp. TaxID=1968838 RepID=UPI00262C4E54